MSVPINIIDAFTVNDEPFTGNGAAVCLLEFDDDISDDIKQKLATEMNLSETAFVAKAWNKDSLQEKNTFTIRWFSLNAEVEWCGHATLASSRAVFDNFPSSSITFKTKFIGNIKADIDSKRENISICFPIADYKPIDLKTNTVIEQIVGGILSTKLNFSHVRDVQLSGETKYLLICLKDGDDLIGRVSPNFNELVAIQNNDSVLGCIVTQRSDDNKFHFYSRFFAPWLENNEDPVTGSAHAILAPYWKKIYEQNGIQTQELIGRQRSKRGGIVVCRINGERVTFIGRTRTVVTGKIHL